ncbi:MAG: amidohydrolase family protein [Myxococcales bacterium]|nr:amidohydrolase family protein [Myxococcales bacterium]
MTPIARRALLVGLLAAAACGHRDPPWRLTSAQPGDVAIVGATVIPMDRDGVLRDHAVLVRGDRIVAVVATRALDARAATVIDGRGRWVTPGLADMHVHFWDRHDLDLFLLNGVTTVRNLFGSPTHLRWRAAVARGELAGPTIVTAGPIIDGDPPTWPGSAVVTTAAEATAAVQAQHAAGYDWIKVYGGLSVEAYRAALAEAARLHLPVAGHVPHAVGVAAAIASGQRSIEHLDGYVPFLGDAPRGDLVTPTVAAGVWNCPTLVVTDRFGRLDDPAQLADTRGLALVAPAVRAAWDPQRDFRLRTFTPAKFATVRAKNLQRQALVRALADAGAPLVLGTDTGNPYVVPGFAVVDELRLLVAAGLTPRQALRMATVAAGELLGTPGEVGVIAPGARADLLVLDADPLADVANVADPAIVVARGVAHPRAALLAAAALPAADADPFAAQPALPTEGAPIAAARYQVAMLDQVIGHERIAVRELGGQRIVHGQAVYGAPQALVMRYRATADQLDLTCDCVAPPHLAVTRTPTGVAATPDGRPAVALAAAADAVLAPQAVAEFVWYAAALADLPVGAARTLTAAEVMTDGEVALHPGRFQFTRGADVDGRRSYAIVGQHGELALTGHLRVAPDGLPHEVSVTVSFGTFTTRRLE